MNPAERWLPVVGYEDHYEVSDMGRVKRIKPGKGTYPGRILTNCRGTHGYPIVKLVRDGVGPTFKVHRLVLLAFVGPPEPGQEGCHKTATQPTRGW